MPHIEHPLQIEYVPPDVLAWHPENPRVGDIDVIKTSLHVNGQYRPLVVSRVTRHVLAGNHTLAAAIALGYPEIAVIWLDDLDADAERRILAVDNRSADLGSYDTAALLRLLTELDDLAGTGYQESDLNALADIADDTPPPPIENPFDKEPAAIQEITFVLSATKKEQLMTWLDERLRPLWGDHLTNGELVHKAVSQLVDRLDA